MRRTIPKNNKNNNNTICFRMNGTNIALLVIFTAVLSTMSNYWYIHQKMSDEVERQTKLKVASELQLKHNNEEEEDQTDDQKQKQQQQQQQNKKKKDKKVVPSSSPKKSSSSASSSSSSHSDSFSDPDPVWWIESESDNFVSRTYGDLSNLTYLRDHSNTMQRYFAPLCGHYRFDINSMPTASVIITTQTEASPKLSWSVHSILARTHPKLLKEIIIVDDNGLSSEWRTYVNETELLLLSQLPKVRVLQNTIREGCARSRLAGAEAALGDILVFVDSHIEMLSSTWLEHLMLPIIENQRTMSVQTIDVINDVTHEYSNAPGELQLGVIDEKFFFSYRDSRFWGRAKEKPSIGGRLPYETPFVPGSLFAMQKTEFWRLGGYDRGLYVWGGENTELALKVWMCGGRVVMVPCSRVGHVYRVNVPKTGGWPPKLPQELTDRLGCAYPNGFFKVWNGKADNFTKIVTRNNMRIMMAWIGMDHPAKRQYYKRAFGTSLLPPEWKQYEEEAKSDAAFHEQLAIKDQLQCRDFDWFDRHVYMKLLGVHHPWYEDDDEEKKKVNCGGHMAVSCEACARDQGERYCNGQCQWCRKNGGFCHLKNDKSICA